MLKLILFILISTSFAQEVAKKKDKVIKAIETIEVNKTKIAKSTDLKIKLGAFYATGCSYRGALVWEAPVAAVGPTITFYNKYTIGRNGLSYSKIVNKRHIFTASTSFFSDDEPQAFWIKLEGEEKDFKNGRSPTYGTFAEYYYSYKYTFSFKSQLHKDLDQHHGFYFSNELLYSFIPLIAFGLEFGIGDKSSNQYFYGESANAGHAHNNYFMSVLVPFLPYKGVMILKYSNHEILGKDNYNANYIRGRSVHNQFSAVALWDI